MRRYTTKYQSACMKSNYSELVEYSQRRTTVSTEIMIKMMSGIPKWVSKMTMELKRQKRQLDDK